MLKLNDDGSVNKSQYHNPTPYPERPKSPSKPRAGSPPDSYRQYAEELEKFLAEQAAWREKIAEWNKVSQAFSAKFKPDLLKHLGWGNRPGGDIIFSMAWDRGHAAGLNEVYLEAKELAYQIDEILQENLAMLQDERDALAETIDVLQAENERLRELADE